MISKIEIAALITAGIIFLFCFGVLIHDYYCFGDNVHCRSVSCSDHAYL